MTFSRAFIRLRPKFARVLYHSSRPTGALQTIQARARSPCHACAQVPVIRVAQFHATGSARRGRSGGRYENDDLDDIDEIVDYEDEDEDYIGSDEEEYDDSRQEGNARDVDDDELLELESRINDDGGRFQGGKEPMKLTPPVRPAEMLLDDPVCFTCNGSHWTHECPNRNFNDWEHFTPSALPQERVNAIIAKLKESGDFVDDRQRSATTLPRATKLPGSDSGVGGFSFSLGKDKKFSLTLPKRT